MRRFKVTVNGRQYDVEVVEVGEGISTEARGATCPTSPAGLAVTKATAAAEAEKPTPLAPAQQGAAAPEGLKRVEAPLAGTILSVRCRPGDRVKTGDVLLTLEALKLENEIASPYSGVVRSINASPGESVEAGALLATIEESTP